MNSILLDTQTLFYVLYEDYKVPKEVQDLILQQQTTVFFSVISLWEITLKHSLHPSELPVPIAKVYADALDSGFTFLSLKPEHIFSLESLPYALGHKDPFDRLLIAQSKVEESTILTTDDKMSSYDNVMILQYKKLSK